METHIYNTSTYMVEWEVKLGELTEISGLSICTAAEKRGIGSMNWNERQDSWKLSDLHTHSQNET